MSFSKPLSVQPRLRRFARDESGAALVLGVVFVIIACALAGLAMDPAHLFREKARLTAAADIAAHEGVVALSQGVQGEDLKDRVEAAVLRNAPVAEVGTTFDSVRDIRLVRFDPYTRAVAEPREGESVNAVQVTLRRDEMVDNSVANTFLKLVGIDDFDVAVTSVAYYGQPGRCTSSDGMYAKGQITFSSSNWIGPRYCVHSQTQVWLPQQNVFAPTSGVSMPNLAACKGKCVDSANPGIEAALFQMNLDLPKVADHIASVVAKLKATEPSTLKTSFWANKPRASSFKPLEDVLKPKVVSALTHGSTVSLTVLQFEKLIATHHSLPGGLLYEITCNANGNGPQTAIKLGSSTEGLTDTIRGLAIVTNCSIDVGDNTKIDNALIITTRISSSSVLNASEGAVVGDPLKNCDLDRKVYIMAMSGISVNSNFTASNVALIVNGDINIAANSSSTDVEHKGTSMHSEQEIHLSASHRFNPCSEDMSGLLPNLRTFKMVMPRA
ncbi:pilus assembly protein [Cereibacter sphaeroides]|uniref:TadE/TadG family type IV pilus assembly protein n=1 Tax=Cereibacter sphaeroides TaxID=1063 RepID=UPI001F40993B|nr:TadE/TadG family type IV pilus assembly protein [Cereibacter sphaeroides]MCE6959082.1 pilus assembly protein [Cereibacter sphaeroides]MCE6968323.1 pilus assembly protein [Cereibacter sphaeroides]MCE6974257.1 pilus assembly protein [Cereibacter sphaeroides]